MAHAANSRAEVERTRAFEQPPLPNLTMAMSLEQPLTVEAAPVEAEVLEAAALPIMSDQLGEHAAELTPNAAVVDPIGGLTIETIVPSPTRRRPADYTNRSCNEMNHDANETVELEVSRFTN